MLLCPRKEIPRFFCLILINLNSDTPRRQWVFLYSHFYGGIMFIGHEEKTEYFITSGNVNTTEGETKIMVQSCLWLKRPRKTIICLLPRGCIERRWWDNSLVRVTTSEGNSHSKFQGTISITNQLQFLTIITDGSRFKPYETLIRNIHRRYYESWNSLWSWI